MPTRRSTSATGSSTPATSTPSTSSRPASPRRSRFTVAAPLLEADDARASTGSASTRSGERGEGRDTARRRPGPHLPPAGAARARGAGRRSPLVVPLRRQLDLRRRTGRSPTSTAGRRRLERRRPAPLPGRFGAAAGDRTGHLAGRPGAARRRPPARRRQPAALARANLEPAGRRTTTSPPTSPIARPTSPTPTAPPEDEPTRRRTTRRARPRRDAGRSEAARRLARPAARRRCGAATRCWRCRTATSTCPAPRDTTRGAYARSRERAGAPLPGVGPADHAGGRLAGRLPRARGARASSTGRPRSWSPTGCSRDAARRWPSVGGTRRRSSTSSGAADGGPGPDDPLGAARDAAADPGRGRGAVPRAATGAPAGRAAAPRLGPDRRRRGFFSGLDVDWLDLTSVERCHRDARRAGGRPPTTCATPQRQVERRAGRGQLRRRRRAASPPAQTLQNLLTLNDAVGGDGHRPRRSASTSYSARARPDASRALGRPVPGLDRRPAARRSRSRRPPAVTLSSIDGRFRRPSPTGSTSR